MAEAQGAAVIVRSDLAQWAELCGYLRFICPPCFHKFYSDGVVLDCPSCGYSDNDNYNYNNDSNSNQLQGVTQCRKK